ncbi:MAG: hypothetical protein ACRENH_11700 [Gemmatimonadaceae bacterium]
MRSRAHTLGIALVSFFPVMAHAQMTGRSSAGSSVTLSAPRPSSLPTIQMGSLQPRTFDRVGRDFDRWRGTRQGFSPIGCSWGNCLPGRFRTGIVGIPYVTETFVPYAVPVYVPVPTPVQPKYWARDSQKISQPYDPTKSRMLTVGEGADGGGGVMRIERLENNVLRLTWRGSLRPIREARLFIADSLQKTLRSARVDSDTPSALFEIANLEGKIAFAGLIVTYADGAVQTTLVPYPPREDKNP